MLAEFQEHVAQLFPELHGARILVAASGGIDSMALVSLCLQSNFNIALAHCDFSLRGHESLDDAKFVADFAAAHGLVLHLQKFDTRQFAEDYGLSIQVAARDLRYKWFAELADAHGYSCILTAHHLDDTLETFLINLSRGTGLDGLTGIPARNGRIARPLLGFTREQIYRYASAEGLAWREDSSNDATVYMRNAVRHEIVPRLKSLNRNFEGSFADTLQHLQQAKSMVRDAAIMAWGQVTIEKEDRTLFRIADLLRIPDYPAYLHYWLKDFGFTAWEDIYRLPHAESGKKVIGKGFELLRDRETLVLSPIAPFDESDFDVGRDGIENPVRIHISDASSVGESSERKIYVDGSLLKFPLKLRRWRKGDYFYPAGVNGRKTLSKFLRDEKVPIAERPAIWLLVSGDSVIWVVGRRQDGRFRATKQTPHILQIES